MADPKDLATTVLKNLHLEPKLTDEILSVGRLKKVETSQVVIGPGPGSDEFPIVLQGLLKVNRIDREGREILLYYLDVGETCSSSIVCCLEGRKDQVRINAEQDSTLWMIPLAYLDSWMQKFGSFRRFILNAYQDRFDELIDTIDSVTFLRMEERILKYLLDKKQVTGSYIINKTHDEIARDLSTSRVVVSRILKKLENEEKIEQSRNRIEIL